MEVTIWVGCRSAADASARSGIVAVGRSESDFAVTLTQTVAVAVAVAFGRAIGFQYRRNGDAALIDAHLNEPFVFNTVKL